MDNVNKIGIVELIDRILEKGAILNADLIITVAEVPLLAANLRLALASVETMIKYGVMNDWLEATNIVKEEQGEKEQKQEKIPVYEKIKWKN